MLRRRALAFLFGRHFALSVPSPQGAPLYYAPLRAFHYYRGRRGQPPNGTMKSLTPVLTPIFLCTLGPSNILQTKQTQNFWLSPSHNSRPENPNAK